MIRGLLASPWVVIPAGLGAASFLIGMAMGQPAGYFSFLGITGMLLGLGMAATRLLGGSADEGQGTSEDPHSAPGIASRAYLERLKRRIRDDDDPRTDRLFKDLTRLNERMTRLGVTESSGGSEAVVDIREKAVELYRCCLISLERTLVLHDAAEEMATTEARDRLLAEREQLLGEVGGSVAHLGATLDHLHTLQLKRHQSSEELTRMRQELEMGLEVAQRVEQRMESLQRELSPHRFSKEPDGGLPPAAS